MPYMPSLKSIRECKIFFILIKGLMLQIAKHEMEQEEEARAQEKERVLAERCEPLQLSGLSISELQVKNGNKQ